MRNVVAIGMLAAISPSVWAQCEPAATLEFSHAQPEENDRFGTSVAVSGDLIVVGAPFRERGFNIGGAAYVMDALTGQILTAFRVDPDWPGDQFGCAVGISGDRVIVGSRFAPGIGPASGSAYIFDAGDRDQVYQLIASNANTGAHFGFSVAIDGTIAVVGAPDHRDGVLRTGAAYVFDAYTGQQLFQLTPDDPAHGDSFGWSVDVSDQIAIVGASGADPVGAAYLFDIGTGEQLFKLVPSGVFPGDAPSYGRSVAIHGNRAVVGTHGAAYVFDVATGTELYRLSADGLGEPDRFGHALSMNDDTILVGAPLSDGPQPDVGSACLFDLATGALRVTLTAAGAETDDNFGCSVALGDTWAVVGAMGRDIGGSALVFDGLAGTTPCVADMNDDCRLDFFDLQQFLTLFGAADPRADIAADGVWDFSDVLAFLGAFSAGCP